MVNAVELDPEFKRSTTAPVGIASRPKATECSPAEYSPRANCAAKT